MKCAKLTDGAALQQVAKITSALALLVAASGCDAQEPVATAPPLQMLHVGAERTASYLPLLAGKRVGVVTNQTGLIGSRHLVDSLLSSDIHVVKVFAPEHGFRGEADAGEHVKDQRDVRTGLPLVSLYGANKSEEAIDELIAIIKRKRDWNEDAARKQLLKIFEALGFTNPITVAGRRKLSAVLFS